MTLSVSWTTVPIVGTWRDRNGDPLSGTIDFCATVAVHVDGILVVPTIFTANVINGVLATTLPVTSDPGTQTYTVKEHLGYARSPYDIIVVYGATSVNLTDGSINGTPPVFYSPGAVVSLIAGPPGPPGPSGGGTFSVVAGTALSAHRIVRPQSDGTAIYATNTLLADASRALWITLTAAASPGDTINVQGIGPVGDVSFSWSDLPMFLGTNGVITQTPPTRAGGAAFICQLGSYETTTSLYYDPRIPIVL